MLTNLQSAINAVADEKNLDPAIIYEAIDAAIAAAWKREYGEREMTAIAKFDPKNEQSRVWRTWKVVEDDAEIEEPLAELPLFAAKEKDAKAEVGGEVREEVTPKAGFGRIAAQSAKQVILQKLRSAENEMIADFYKDKVQTVVVATVRRVTDTGDVEVEVERTNALLFRSKLIPRERIYQGARIKVFVEEIRESARGPQVILTRTAPELVKNLLETEIPEVTEGKVEIRGVAREPGVRAKVAVASTDPTVDPVGACVGQKGVRVQALMDEIAGEYIDLIEWTDDREEFVRRTLKPAEISGMAFDDESEPRRIQVFLAEDQRSVAIGRGGQNVRLAGILLDAEVDIRGLDDLEKFRKTGELPAAERKEEETPREDSSEKEKSASAEDSIAKKEEAEKKEEESSPEESAEEESPAGKEEEEES